ncbi:hypothetical protein [Streptomyces incarnatus]|uniref:hypothetical protein n=1 Tax=Streptomyces incarnatus TaxID=665007 RepID=UPI001AD7FA7E|nr:hypothetical protein [Streptomyces incarnatus]
MVDQIGLTQVTETSWSAGAELIDRIAHEPAERFSRVLVTPALNGWVLVIGPWCGLPYLNRTADVTRLCLELSTRHGRAHQHASHHHPARSTAHRPIRAPRHEQLTTRHHEFKFSSAASENVYPATLSGGASSRVHGGAAGKRLPDAALPS